MIILMENKASKISIILLTILSLTIAIIAPLFLIVFLLALAVIIFFRLITRHKGSKIAALMKSRIIQPIIAAIFCALFAIVPILNVLLGSFLGKITGCTSLNEGSVEGCIAFGMDISSQIYQLFVSGWYGVITLPIGAIALIP